MYAFSNTEGTSATVFSEENERLTVAESTPSVIATTPNWIFRAGKYREIVSGLGSLILVLSLGVYLGVETWDKQLTKEYIRENTFGLHTRLWRVLILQFLWWFKWQLLCHWHEATTGNAWQKTNCNRVMIADEWQITSVTDKSRTQHHFTSANYCSPLLWVHSAATRIQVGSDLSVC